MHNEERPREKALKYGVENLGNRELLAIILRCGYKGVSVLQVADNLIDKAQGMAGIIQLDVTTLTSIKGISKIKAVELLACFEISKRVMRDQLKTKVLIQSPQDIANYLMHKIGTKKQEHFVVLFLNTKHQVINEETIFIGSLNASVVHAREIFRAAIIHSSAKILISHNHPTNDCIPSENDILVTNSINEVSKLVGIPLLDHIIVGHNSYFSFKEKQLID